MKLACDNIQKEWEDELIYELMNFPREPLEFKEYFCIQYTQICENVSLPKFFEQEIARSRGLSVEKMHELFAKGEVPPEFQREVDQYNKFRELKEL